MLHFFTLRFIAIGIATVRAAVAVAADHASTCMGLFDSAMHMHMEQSHMHIHCSCWMHMHMGQAHTRMGLSHTRIRVYTVVVGCICILDRPICICMELSNSPMHIPAWTVLYVKMRCFALYPDALDNS